jgi:hypothetical protein
MVDENKLYKLLVEPCDPDTKKLAKALYKEIVETLKTAEPTQGSAVENKAVSDKIRQLT